jgi:xylose dehydrogenase (NAD/NADP)
MTAVQWGVLGCSDFARRRTIPALLESPASELIAIASRSADKAAEFRDLFRIPRAYHGYEALLADPDIQAVYIPLPCALHAEWMIRAAHSGKHCLCEKPFTSSLEEARGVQRVFSGCGLFVMEAFMWRLHGQHRRARLLVDRGFIGQVRLVRSGFTLQMKRRPDIRLQPELGGGSLLDLGCYPISAARFYFAAEPRSVYARADIDPEYRVDMSVAGMMEFEQGRALFECGFNLPYRTELEIVGDQGAIRIPRPWLPEPEATLTVNGNTETLPFENEFVTQFEFFSTCILEGGAPHFGAEDAVRQMRVIDAVQHSIRSGSPEQVS